MTTNREAERAMEAVFEAAVGAHAPGTARSYRKAWCGPRGFATHLGTGTPAAALAVLAGQTPAVAKALVDGYRAELARRGLKPSTVALRSTGVRCVVDAVRRAGLMAAAEPAPSRVPGRKPQAADRPTRGQGTRRRVVGLSPPDGQRSPRVQGEANAHLCHDRFLPLAGVAVADLYEPAGG